MLVVDFSCPKTLVSHFRTVKPIKPIKQAHKALQHDLTLCWLVINRSQTVLPSILLTAFITMKGEKKSLKQGEF